MGGKGYLRLAGFVGASAEADQPTLWE